MYQRKHDINKHFSPQVIEFDDSSGSVLRIQPLRTHRDEAIYECTATNNVGEINTSAKLTVLEGETLHVYPSDFFCNKNMLTYTTSMK